jgi:hypothetical protein
MMEWMSFRMKVLLVILASLVIIGTAGFGMIEGLSLFNSFYLTIITISTVGYGDLTPVTQAGKTLSIFLILAGTGSFLALLATVIETLVSGEEKAKRAENLHMTVGVFFSEIGNGLLESIKCKNAGMVKERLSAIKEWDRKGFEAAKKEIESMTLEISLDQAGMKKVGAFLSAKRDLLLRFLENPNLLEHETFADLLQAVFHVLEELETRKGIIAKEERHVEEDLRLVYHLMIREWIEYVRYLKFNYPHFFTFMADNSPLTKAE